ncbi:MAG: HDOD domain-containing protein [Gammaproteobacteria bacterium]|nr:HDOD domain-containing protein [Gammaproteobacteria bacterium]
MNSTAIGELDVLELPVPPEGSLNVVRACTQADIDAPSLGKLVVRSPVLSAEILRVSNSAYFGFPSKITSIAHAVTLVGHRTLRNMALCSAMKETLKPDQVPAFPVEEYWESALRRAVCAQHLAVEVGSDTESAFTAGLLQDFGLLVLFFLHHNRVCEWPGLAELSPDARYELELQLFGTTHDKVGLQLAETWNLPPVLKLALGHHHDGPPEGADEQAVAICRLTQCADWMASVFTAENRRHSIKLCRSLLLDYFGVDTAKCDGLLEQIPGLMNESASSLGFGLGEQVTYDELIQEANLNLAEENLNFQQMNWHLQHTLEERDRIAGELNRELASAREVQRGLLPSDSGGCPGFMGLNLSAKAVSGDFYDYFRLRNGEIAFCIADVSGKGMNAALLMAKVSSLFHCLGKSILDPSKLLGMLNREILETTIQGMFVTMVAGVFNPDTRRVRLANAGHLPVAMMRDSRLVSEYPAAAPPLGIIADVVFPLEEFQLSGDSSLYLYTDGLVDGKWTIDQETGVAGLYKVFARHWQAPLCERLQYVAADIRALAGRLEDDVTILALEI